MADIFNNGDQLLSIRTKLNNNAYQINSLAAHVSSLQVEVNSNAAITGVTAASSLTYDNSSSSLVSSWTRQAIDELDWKVGSQGVQVNSLSTRVTSLATQVGSLSTRVDSLSVQVGSISTQVGSHAAAISSLQAGGGGGGTSWTFTNSQSGLATAGDIVLLDTTSATPTKNFPTAPSDGDEVWFVDDSGSAGSNNITLIASDTLVMGVTSSFTVNVDYGRPRFKYFQTNSDWRLIGV